ncbi:MAG: UDP-glucose 4-epimerase GalE [Saprospiraceae bacterium]|nr:UDP-glucose 4-epimerase GalE [Saprospiraceae bacterium]
MSKILVTGACGYIGSHTLVDLIENGYDVISVDSNIRSKPNILEGVKKITGKIVPHYAIDLCDLEATKSIFEANQDIQGIIHFAALKSVPESVAKPLLYYRNNLNSLANILECIDLYKIPSFIFSSSCSVYGNTTALPVVETTPFEQAQCPYAHTKQVGEEMVRAFLQNHPNSNSILLRYFNPAGAHPSAHIGEIPQAGAYNVVPIIFECALRIRPPFKVTGSDYNTRDGSCVRDYVHVMDVANAHTRALQYLEHKGNEENCEVFNVGIGDGVTVLELIQAFERVTKEKLDYSIGKRRAGDVPAIYADYTKAANLLGWQPKYSIDDIIQTAWAWELKRRSS